MCLRPPWVADAENELPFLGPAGPVSRRHSSAGQRPLPALPGSPLLLSVPAECSVTSSLTAGAEFRVAGHCARRMAHLCQSPALGASGPLGEQGKLRARGAPVVSVWKSSLRWHVWRGVFLFCLAVALETLVPWLREDVLQPVTGIEA